LDIGTQIGPYLITGRLGRGGMGEVYRARDTILDREVAVKALPPNVRGDVVRLSRFEREAKLLASLNHPNIATLHGLEQVGDERYLVMELVEGVVLDRLLASGPLPVEQAVRIGRQIAEALEAAHEKGIVHRDLKPANVMVSPKGRVKVLDFGVAKSMDSVPTFAPGREVTVASLTAPGIAVGTPPYMSPEQVRGQVLDDRSDIWAFGCLLYEMLTGKRAYQGDTWADTLSAILTQEPDWQALPADVPEVLRDLLGRCLARDRDRRMPRIGEVRAELDCAFEARSSAIRVPISTPPTVLELPRSLAPAAPSAHGSAARLPRLPRRAWIAAAGLAVALAAGGLAVLPKLRSLEGKPQPVPGLRDIRSLVVLPSRVLGDESDRFLADAIPNTVSTHLAQIDGLETKSPPTSMELDRVGWNLNDIAESYHVGAVVLPTVTVTGDMLILNLQLVAIPSRVVLWTRDFEDRRQRYLDLARAAAEGIRQALRPATPALARSADVAASSEAELALHQGLFLSNLYRRQGLAGDFERARLALQQALELDPRQAQAAAEIARLQAARVVTGVPPQQIVPEVRRWAQRALEIDPRSSRAWAVLSEAEQIDPQGSYQKMLDDALKAAAFGPKDGYAHTRLSFALSRRSFLLGLKASERAAQLDPLELSSALSDAIYLMAISRLDEARSRVERALRIEPEMPYGMLVLALVETFAGRGEAATAIAARLAPMASDGRIRPDWLKLIQDYTTFEKGEEEGDREAAGAAAGRLLRAARGKNKFPRWESATAQVAPLLARHGRAEEALDLMLARADMGVVENYEFLLLNRDLEPLRADPRFRRLLDQARTRFNEMLDILSAARSRGEYPAYLDPALHDLLPLIGIPRRW
jgi:serine/threonine protein kinase/tetratricopeptide (TPR) repeat protein